MNEHPNAFAGGPDSQFDKSVVASQYAAEVEIFNRQMRAVGFRDIDRYYWYHTVDLPGFAVTPGMYDFRTSIERFKLPPDMSGKTVLDVGSATGFFAFEFEKRGAEVLSIELPGLEQLDRFPGQETSWLLEKIQKMIVPHSERELGPLVRRHSPQELHYYLLDAPFRLCSRFLNSRVRRHFCTIYELSPERLGAAAFDFVFLGDVLVHTLRPFDGLVAASRMCRETLMIAQTMPGGPEDPAAMIYAGGSELAADDICWWLPNEQCLRQILLKLGFARVTVIGDHEGILRPAGHWYKRRIIRADRQRAIE